MKKIVLLGLTAAMLATAFAQTPPAAAPTYPTPPTYQVYENGQWVTYPVNMPAFGPFAAPKPNAPTATPTPAPKHASSATLPENTSAGKPTPNKTTHHKQGTPLTYEQHMYNMDHPNLTPNAGPAALQHHTGSGAAKARPKPTTAETAPKPATTHALAKSEKLKKQ